MRRTILVFSCLLLAALILLTNVGAGKLPAQQPVSPETPQSVITSPSPERVEILEKRTRTSKHFRNPDGSYTAEIRAGSVHYQDAQGKWQDIDNALMPTAVSGYAYQNAANTYQVLFASAGGANSFLLKEGARSLRFSPLTPNSSTGVIDGRSIVYPSAFVDSSADLRYIVGNDTVEAVVVLKGPGVNSFSFLLEPNGLTPRLTSTGHIELADPASGEVIWAILRPFVIDNNGEFTTDASYTLTQQGSGYLMNVEVSPQWLDAPERAYPVVIDPTVTIQPASGDTMMSSQYPNTNYNGTYLIAGNMGGTNRYRTLLQFGLSSVPSNSRIDSASLGLYMWTDPYGQNADFTVYRLLRLWLQTQATWTEATTGTGWTNNNGGAEDDYDKVYDYSTITITPGGYPKWATWTVTGMVSDWYLGLADNYGMLVRGDDESTTYKRKYFDSNDFYPTPPPDLRPRLVVDYTPIAKMVFTTSTQTLYASQVSAMMTIQTQDANGNPINVINVTGNTTVNLSSSSGNGTFYSDAAGNNQLNPARVTIYSGSATASFYYKDTDIGTPTLTAAEDPYTWYWTDATQQQTCTLEQGTYTTPWSDIAFHSDSNITGVRANLGTFDPNPVYSSGGVWFWVMLSHEDTSLPDDPAKDRWAQIGWHKVNQTGFTGLYVLLQYTTDNDGEAFTRYYDTTSNSWNTAWYNNTTLRPSGNERYTVTVDPSGYFTMTFEGYPSFTTLVPYQWRPEEAQIGGETHNHGELDSTNVGEHFPGATGAPVQASDTETISSGGSWTDRLFSVNSYSNPRINIAHVQAFSPSPYYIQFYDVRCTN